MYWDRARALQHAGRKSEAVAALRIYIAHCKDERDLPEAESLLRELQPD